MIRADAGIQVYKSINMSQPKCTPAAVVTFPLYTQADLGVGLLSITPYTRARPMPTLKECMLGLL